MPSAKNASICYVSEDSYTALKALLLSLGASLRLKAGGTPCALEEEEAILTRRPYRATVRAGRPDASAGEASRAGSGDTRLSGEPVRLDQTPNYRENAILRSHLMLPVRSRTAYTPEANPLGSDRSRWRPQRTPRSSL